MKRSLLYILIIVCMHTVFGATTRIKDIASIQGIRENQLIGYGLIVGLDGTGDSNKSQFTIQSLATMLRNMGINVPVESLKVKNVAAVMVTAVLPPFVREGEKIDILLSSVGDASSLQGGTLLLTPLKGPDGIVYAVGQGPISIGGFNIRTEGGTNFRKNHATVGRIPEGAIVEREVATTYVTDGKISYLLRNPDFTTAYAVEKAINTLFKNTIARAVNEKEIVVIVPETILHPNAFIAAIENLMVETDTRARVVINERTGTVVAGEFVKIKTIAITHGSLTVRVNPETSVSQPNFMTQGRTTTVTNETADVQDQKGQFLTMPSNTTVGEMAELLNTLGVSPRDMVAIFLAIKQSGALEAELVVM